MYTHPSQHLQGCAPFQLSRHAAASGAFGGNASYELVFPIGIASIQGPFVSVIQAPHACSQFEK